MLVRYSFVEEKINSLNYLAITDLFIKLFLLRMYFLIIYLFYSISDILKFMDLFIKISLI